MACFPSTWTSNDHFGDRGMVLVASTPQAQTCPAGAEPTPALAPRFTLYFFRNHRDGSREILFAAVVVLNLIFTITVDNG